MTNTQRVFLATFIGTFVFGFIDNFILVLAGDLIDNTIAQKFGFSTMASAGLGNAISDAVGEMFGGAIAAGILLLTGPAEEESVPTWQIIAVGVIGIVFGCIAGMFPLLWM